MRSLGKRISSVQFRVGSPVLGEWLSGNSRPHRSRICEPWRCKSSLAYQSKESKPQQTGTGLLIRYGEVATTSGSTNSLPGRLIVGQRPFEGANAGAIPAQAANFGNSSFDPPGGEIESRLAYTQKSEGQNLSGRPAFALRATAWRAIACRAIAQSATARRGSQFPWPAASINKEQTPYRAEQQRVQTFYERHPEQDDRAGA